MMALLYCYGIALKSWAFMRNVAERIREQYAVDEVPTDTAEEFIALLRKHGCDFSDIQITRAGNQANKAIEDWIFIRAKARLEKGHKAVCLINTGFDLPLNSERRKLEPIEAQARAFARHLRRNGIDSCVNDEFGCVLFPLHNSE